MPIDLLPQGGSTLVLSEQKYVKLNSHNLDYDATASLRKSKDKIWVLILEVRLKRKISRSIIEIIAPSGLLVIVSWVRHYGPFIIRTYKHHIKILTLADQFFAPCGFSSRANGFFVDAISLHSQHFEFNSFEHSQVWG